MVQSSDVFWLNYPIIRYAWPALADTLDLHWPIHLTWWPIRLTCIGRYAWPALADTLDLHWKCFQLFFCIEHCPIIGLSDYPIIRLSDYPIIRLSDYPIIRLPHYPIILRKIILRKMTQVETLDLHWKICWFWSSVSENPICRLNYPNIRFTWPALDNLSILIIGHPRIRSAD